MAKWETETATAIEVEDNVATMHVSMRIKGPPMDDVDGVKFFLGQLAEQWAENMQEKFDKLAERYEGMLAGLTKEATDAE